MKIYEKDYDFEIYNGYPRKFICLAFIPRSASNFLAMEMRKTGLLGYPLEYFSHANIFGMVKRLDGDYPQSLYSVRTSPNGIFGYKWNAGFEYSPGRMDHIIFLDREDRYAQAKSFCIAKKTGEWLEVGSKGYDPTKLEIELELEFLNDLRMETLDTIKYCDYLALSFDDVVNDSSKTIKRIKEFVFDEGLNCE